jgi:hypothetical protein
MMGNTYSVMDYVKPLVFKGTPKIAPADKATRTFAPISSAPAVSSSSVSSSFTARASTVKVAPAKLTPTSAATAKPRRKTTAILPAKVADPDEDAENKLAAVKTTLAAPKDYPYAVFARSIGTYGNVIPYEAQQMQQEFIGHIGAPSTYLHNRLPDVKLAGPVGLVFITFKTNLLPDQYSSNPALFKEDAETEIVEEFLNGKRSRTPKLTVGCTMGPNYREACASTNDLETSLLKEKSAEAHYNESVIHHERIDDLAGFYITHPQNKDELLSLRLFQTLFAFEGTIDIPVLQLSKKEHQPIEFGYLKKLNIHSLDEAKTALVDALYDAINAEGAVLNTKLLEKTYLSMIAGVTKDNEVTYMTMNEIGDAVRTENYERLREIRNLLRDKVQKNAPNAVKAIELVYKQAVAKITAREKELAGDPDTGRLTELTAQMIEVIAELEGNKDSLIKVNGVTYHTKLTTPKTYSKGWVSYRKPLPIHAASNITKLPYPGLPDIQKSLTNNERLTLHNTILGLYENDPSLINNSKAQKMFMEAIQCNDFVRCEVLLRMGLNPDFTVVMGADKKTTPFIAALQHGEFEIIHHLLDADLDMTQKHNSDIALEFAIKGYSRSTTAEQAANYLEVMSTLLKQGVTLNEENAKLVQNNEILMTLFDVSVDYTAKISPKRSSPPTSPAPVLTSSAVAPSPAPYSTRPSTHRAAPTASMAERYTPSTPISSSPSISSAVPAPTLYFARPSPSTLIPVRAEITAPSIAPTILTSEALKAKEAEALDRAFIRADTKFSRTRLMAIIDDPEYGGKSIEEKKASVDALLKSGANPNLTGKDNQIPAFVRAIYHGYYDIAYLFLNPAYNTDVNLCGAFREMPVSALGTAIDRYDPAATDNSKTLALIKFLLIRGAQLHPDETELAKKMAAIPELTAPTPTPSRTSRYVRHLIIPSSSSSSEEKEGRGF